jgi:diaminopimelate decarboxylase
MLPDSPPTSFLEYRNGALSVEEVALSSIAARFGTPCFVYSRAALASAFDAFDHPFGERPHLICYAAKANSNLAILNLLARRGSGFDIVSGGELERVLAAGADPGKVVFSGVGKRADEIGLALAHDILCFNVESESELMRISRMAAAAGRDARISVRVNPDVDPRTHPYISTGLRENKFGVPFERALELYRVARSLAGVEIRGIDYHIGSQVTEVAPFLDALDKLLGLADRLQAEGIALDHFDLGGGLGIRYRDETPPQPRSYIEALLQRLGERSQSVILEPGRALVGNAGVLLTRVEYLKHGPERNFAIVDAAMNDLLRPALYQSFHDIVAVHPREGARRTYQIVGPVCESADFLGNDRDLALLEGDLLGILSAGAYGMSMSSNYNSRPRAPEVMVDGATVHLVRARETIAQLFALERLLPESGEPASNTRR